MIGPTEAARFVFPIENRMTDWPFAHGGAPLTARLRTTPDDFLVEEIPGFAADGEGEHVLLWIEKRDSNTQWVARELARFADVKTMAVGFAGLKDRHAVTRQMFTVQLAGKPEPDWAAFPHAEVKILGHARHRRKLKRGALKGNRFTLVLRDVAGAREDAERVLTRIAERGVPNYFGEQRFGRDGDNVEQARAMFAGQHVDRALRSILISAARSELFNAVLARRVQDDTWDKPLDGEVWCLAGSHSRFGPEAFTPELAERLARGDIHPSGPLWGRGELPASGAARAIEQGVVAEMSDLCAGLERVGLEQDRRALRLSPQDFAWRWLADDALRLSFALPAGSYATTVVRELAGTA